MALNEASMGASADIDLHAEVARSRLSGAPAFAVFALVGSAVLSAACGPDKEAQKLAQDQAAFEQAAAQDPEFSDPLGRAIADAARVEARGWVKEGKFMRGTLEERGRQAFLVVLRYGHCYRFIGTAQDANDMDLLLFDANGVETQRDVTQSATPILGASASICPTEPSAVRIEARMRAGRGAFAIALFHDPA